MSKKGDNSFFLKIILAEAFLISGFFTWFILSLMERYKEL